MDAVGMGFVAIAPQSSTHGARVRRHPGLSFGHRRSGLEWDGMGARCLRRSSGATLRGRRRGAIAEEDERAGCRRAKQARTSRGWHWALIGGASARGPLLS